MDLTKLGRGEKIAAISAIVLLFVMFVFDWFGLSVGPFEVSGNAWDAYSFTNWVLLITVIAALGLAYLSATNQALNLPIAASAIVTGLGVLSVILILLSLITPPDFGSSVDLSGSGISHTRKIGAFIGLITAAVLTFGAWTAMQEEGASFTPSGRTGGTGGAPPPP